MIKSCLFDLDGTLLNTLTTIAYYGNKALEKFEIEPIETDKYRYFVGNGAKLLVERMLHERNAYSPEAFNKVYKYYNECYNADVKRYTEPYDGILEMLAELKKRNIAVGIISNKPDFATKGAVADFIPEELVDAVQGQVEGVPIKPAPDGAMSVLSSMNMSPENAMYIGDTWIDMQTGKNLGSYTVGVLWGFREYDELKENGADLIISHPKEIAECIDRLNTL